MARQTLRALGLIALAALLYTLGPACGVSDEYDIGETCISNADCTLSTQKDTCIDGICQAQECVDDGDCTNQICERGACVVAECFDVASGCADGEVCVGLRCVVGCLDESIDCTEFERCDDAVMPGVCLPNPCTEDDDCPLGSICKPEQQSANQVCVAGCRVESEENECLDTRP
jgi:hypothetical protein